MMDQLPFVTLDAAPVPAQADLLEALRRLLEREHRDMNIAAAARRLFVSSRTLQRRLAELGTSFHAELGHARWAAAERLMLTTDWKLAAVADTVGFRSAAHFSLAFRKRTGMTPSTWRRLHSLPSPVIG